MNRGALLSLLRPERARLLGAIGCGVLDQGLGLAAAVLGAVLAGRALTGDSPSELVPGIVLLIVLVLPKVLAGWAESYLAHDFAFRVLAELRDRAYRRLAALTPGYLLRRRAGDLGATALADVELLELFFAHSLSPLVVAATVPFACLVAATVLHPLIGLTLLPAVVALATVPFWLRRWSTPQGEALRETTGAANADVVDAVQGLTETLVFRQELAQTERLRHGTRRLGAALRAHRSRGGVEKAAADALASAGLIAVVGTALWLTAQDRLSTSGLAVAVVLAGYAFLPLLTLVDTWRELAGIRAAAVRLTAILDARPDVEDTPGTTAPDSLTPSVVFEDVHFRYPPDGPDVLRGVDLDLPAGTTLALAGASGAGKSTCASVLLRHWDTRSGTIRVGGADVRDLPQASLHEHVVAVPQHAHLFAMTVRDNIRISRPDADDTEIETAARAAQAHDFIQALPDGYDSPLGERGVRLSGGQRQRIAIARALLSQAPVLILDEATSHLDGATETVLDDTLSAATAGRTVLVIAHRASTLRAAGRIAFLDEGRVAAVGTHEELLASQPRYREMLAEIDRETPVG